MPKKLYLDTAARTPVDARVAKVMAVTGAKFFANPGSIHSFGVLAEQALTAARVQAAAVLKCQPDEIIFTGGGTESDNLAIQGVAETWARKIKSPRIIVSNIEHPAVLETAKKLAATGFIVDYLAVDKDGLVSARDLRKMLRPETVLVSVMLANNEIGTIQPLKEISRVIKLFRREQGTSYPYLHTDACQAGRFLDLAVSKLGVDLLGLSGSKIYGPHGSGLLYVRRGVELQPILSGGGQEGGRRAGTEDVAAASGLALALTICARERERESRRLTSLRDYLIIEIKRIIPGAILNGSQRERLPNNINFSFPGQDGEQLVLRLDARGIAVSSGAACSARERSTSYVVAALGGAGAASALRMTLGRETTKSDVDYLIKNLSALVVKSK